MTQHAVSTAPTVQQQELDRIAQSDHTEGGSRSRPVSVPDSPSELLSTVDSNFNARKPTGTPAYPPFKSPEHDSIKVERRGAPKRKHSTETNEENSERRSHTQEIPCPMPSRVVKLKLTREKMFQAPQDRVSKPRNPLPDCPITSQPSVGQLSKAPDGNDQTSMNHQQKHRYPLQAYCGERSRENRHASRKLDQSLPLCSQPEARTTYQTVGRNARFRCGYP
jgi:hypothetical protein